MSYNTPPTRSPGDIVTAAQWNTYIRDNMEAGVPALFTTKGDMAAATGADAATRIAIGNIGDTLQRDNASDNNLYWKPLFNLTYPVRARRTFNQIITGSVYIPISFDTETYDPANVFTPGSSYIAPISGYYQVHASALLDCGADADNPEAFSLNLFVNGGFVSTIDYVIPEGTPTGWKIFLRGMDFVSLPAGSYVGVYVFQGSGANLNVTEATLAVVRIG